MRSYYKIRGRLAAMHGLLGVTSGIANWPHAWIVINMLLAMPISPPQMSPQPI